MALPPTTAVPKVTIIATMTTSPARIISRSPAAGRAIPNNSLLKGLVISSCFTSSFIACQSITVPTRREKTVAVATPIIPQCPTKMAKEDKIALKTHKRLTSQDDGFIPLPAEATVVIKARETTSTGKMGRDYQPESRDCL